MLLRCFQKYCDGNKRLKDKEGGGRIRILENELRALVKTNSYTTAQKLAEGLTVTIGTISSNVRQSGKLKNWANEYLTN